MKWYLHFGTRTLKDSARLAPISLTAVTEMLRMSQEVVRGGNGRDTVTGPDVGIGGPVSELTGNDSTYPTVSLGLLTVTV